MYSAGYRQTALDRLKPDDGADTSGYTRVLLDKLGTPGESIASIARDVRNEVEQVARGGRRVALGAEARQAVEAARAVVETCAAGPAAAYGINTGFGSLPRQQRSVATPAFAGRQAAAATARWRFCAQS